MTFRIGLDFDNTIVDYRPLFGPAARALGFIDDALPAAGKTGVRDRLRALPGGEERWQSLQAHVYGEAIAYAHAYAGFERFLATAGQNGAQLWIVSHKSRFAAAAPNGPDLRIAAHRWLTSRGIVGASGIGVDNVFFEGSLAEKLQRIADLRLTHFVDDLTDVLEDPAFPRAVTRAVHFRESWDAVCDDIFG
jgi:hypothetical protein